MLWDLNEGKHLYSLEAGDIVNALVFSPNRYWLCAATATCIKIFDLESKCVPVSFFLECLLTPDLLLGRSSMSLSPTSRRTPPPGNPSVSPSPGPLTARPSSEASQTTSSVCGPSSHKRQPVVFSAMSYSVSLSFFAYMLLVHSTYKSMLLRRTCRSGWTPCVREILAPDLIRGLLNLILQL